jgi:hypothetical protein
MKITIEYTDKNHEILTPENPLNPTNLTIQPTIISSIVHLIQSLKFNDKRKIKRLYPEYDITIEE